MTARSDVEMRYELERLQELVKARLDGCFMEVTPYAELLDSMRYSLLAGGKYIRPVLCLAFYAASGGQNEREVLEAACAIEMLHTYTLIHDDLPCMDDDDLRRGKPSNHKVYGEFTATLAGDALQAAAFSAMLRSNFPPETVVKMCRTLADAAGPYGICGGQLLDMRGEKRTGADLSVLELLEIHTLKTAVLIEASSKIGVLAAGGTDEKLAAAGAYARAVGLAFQIRDDLLNLTSDEKQLGKPAGSDKKRGKATFVSVLDREKSEELILEQTELAIAALGRAEFRDTRFLSWLAKMLAERKC